jgi:SAM-dependent methyltransferase
LKTITDKWDEIRPAIEAEIADEGVKRGEFVVSAMTRAMANSLHHAFENYPNSDDPALDIGTGTAYHTMLMLARGKKRVISVDINPQAIAYAKERISRYFPEINVCSWRDFADFQELSASDAQSVNLYPLSLDQVSKDTSTQYSSVCFNPPILYPFFDTKFDKPATHGVYFESGDVENVENDLVYNLYKHLAQNNLRKGSHILCIWANLNRHLVEVRPFTDEKPVYVHPAKILESWFDFTFDNEPESFEDFYRHQTILGANFFNQSATGKLYSDNIRHGIENHAYSKLLVPSESENLSGTYFHFGVLHLVKTSDTENRFEILNGTSAG